MWVNKVDGGETTGQNGSLGQIFVYFLLLFYFFVFLGPHLWHMEVPRLGVELELQLLNSATATATLDPSCISDLRHSLWAIPDP